MREIIFDIETSGCDMADLAPSQQEYLNREPMKEPDPDLRAQKLIDAERFLSLYPFTSEIVVISMLDIQSGTYFTYYNSKTTEESEENFKGARAKFKGMHEKDILKGFWSVMEKADKVITFNGRGFDVPFVLLRSAKLGVKPSKNWMGYRYDTVNHIDLLEQFSYYGAFKRFNLDFYCHAFGIESPKSEEISGIKVQEFYRAGKIKEVAEYCLHDVEATYKLYKIWREYLSFGK
ncbi:MAG: ribonuclease H-like domain-containing protein [Ignavibacteriaceae bacterium]|nr:ribonuclease H-like domain-containing protein [Ignavibacteriaceae bacterium]